MDILDETDLIIEKVTSDRISNNNERMYVLTKTEFEEMISQMKKLKDTILTLKGQING